MKKLLISLAIAVISKSAFAQNNNVTCNPVVNVNTCCENKCKQKTKTVIKKVVVEKKVIVEKPTEKVVYVDRKTEPRKNRLSLLGGTGPARLELGTPTRADAIRGPVLGGMYQRSITERVSIGLQLQTNQTYLGVVGFDF